jgi:hypothetical protein
MNNEPMDKQWHREPGYIIIHRTAKELAWDEKRRRRYKAEKEEAARKAAERPWWMDAGKFFGGLLLLIVIYAVFMIVMGLSRVHDRDGLDWTGFGLACSRRTDARPVPYHRLLVTNQPTTHHGGRVARGGYPPTQLPA